MSEASMCAPPLRALWLLELDSFLLDLFSGSQDGLLRFSEVAFAWAC